MQGVVIHGQNQAKDTATPANFDAAGFGYVGLAITSVTDDVVSAAAGLRLVGYAAKETAAGTAAFEIRYGDRISDPVVNGTMGADTDWTKGTGWTIAAGVATKTAGVASALSQALATLNPGQSYTVVFDLTRTAGSLTASVGGTAGTARSSNATFTEIIVAGSDGLLAFTGDATFAGTVDNVTAVPVTSLIAGITLAANGYAAAYFGDLGIAVPFGLSINDISGTYDITLFTKRTP